MSAPPDPRVSGRVGVGQAVRELLDVHQHVQIRGLVRGLEAAGPESAPRQEPLRLGEQFVVAGQRRAFRFENELSLIAPAEAPEAATKRSTVSGFEPTVAASAAAPAFVAQGVDD